MTDLGKSQKTREAPSFTSTIRSFTMNKAMVLLANGYEEIEAVSVIDIARRSGVDVDVVSITGQLETTGDNGIRIIADLLFEDVNPDDYQAVILPGGIPGTESLTAHEGVQKLLKQFDEQDKLIAAICAAPLALHKANVLKNKRGTGYPACCQASYGENFSHKIVEKSHNIITGQGPAISLFFAYEVAEALSSKETIEQVKAGMLQPAVNEHIKSQN